MNLTHYLINTKNNNKVMITKEEAEKAALIPTDESVVIGRLELSWQRRFVDIEPINNPDIIEDKKKQMTGILRDGTPVKKEFGSWVTLRKIYDDDGKYISVVPDYEHYPEVKINSVATELEFKLIKNKAEKLSLPISNIYDDVVGLTENKKKRLTDNRWPESIGNLLKNRK